jgi:hypothetical protein
MDYNEVSLTIAIISLIVALLTGAGALKGHYVTLTSWSKNRKVAKVRKEIDFVIRARDSDREFYTFALRYGFIVGTLIAMFMVFSGMDTTGDGHKFNLFIRFVIGAFCYFFSAYALANIVRVKNHQNTLEILNRKLIKLGVDPTSNEARDECTACGRRLARDN